MAGAARRRVLSRYDARQHVQAIGQLLASLAGVTVPAVNAADESRAAMKQLLKEIQSGDFAREWIAENRAGQENFKRMREEQAGHQVEVVGRELRAQMDWIDTEFQE